MAWGCCHLHLTKQNSLLKTSKNSNLDDSCISLPAFPSKTNLKLHNISVTPKIIEKVIINPLSAKFIKWSDTLKQFVGKLSTNCFSVIDQFVGLAL